MMIPRQKHCCVCMYFCYALSIEVKKPRLLGKTPIRKAHKIPLQWSNARIGVWVGDWVYICSPLRAQERGARQLSAVAARAETTNRVWHILKDVRSARRIPQRRGACHRIDKTIQVCDRSLRRLKPRWGIPKLFRRFASPPRMCEWTG